MKTLASVLLLLLVCGCASAQVKELNPNGTDLGHKCAVYERQPPKANTVDAAMEHQEISYGMGYCFGVINTAAEILQIEGEIRLPEGNVSFEQLKRVVTNYLDAHPEEWQKPASVLVREALKQAWGTKK